MDRLDRLMAELDGAVARLDARAVPAAMTMPEPLPEPAPTAAPRARWYWTAPASAAPPRPGELAQVTAHP
jgi:hypothetical protein